ncbi:hypothetical protein [Polaromonas sp. C04]|uniref:hypothetical protein n=1 Tax=Polaromonas sp. C04 TaxID=1945857 RepID=UPI0011864DC7|nr:hypothetical protein [Polaromonas sp. C04]
MSDHRSLQWVRKHINSPNSVSASQFPPARKSTDLLKVMLHEQGLDFDIDWFWSGRARCGRLNIRPSGVHAHGRPHLFSVCYSRSTQLWGQSDERLDRLRTGSAKHQAVMAAIRFLEAN